MRWWNYLFSVQRMTWALLLFILGGGPAVWFYGMVELVAASLSVVNTMRARHFDESWRGIALPAFYSLGYFVMPTAMGDGSVVFQLGLFAVGGIRVASLAWLGACYSSGAATALHVVDGGPYSLVRHPMQTSGLLMRLLFMVQFPCWWNLLGFLVMCVAAYAVVRIEEQFLDKFTDFREYVNAVEWRLMPGVW